MMAFISEQRARFDASLAAFEASFDAGFEELRKRQEATFLKGRSGNGHGT